MHCKCETSINLKKKTRFSDPHAGKKKERVRTREQCKKVKTWIFAVVEI